MTYHAIGDSNCLYNTFHLPRFIQHHLGSVRMRDIADGTAPLDIRKLGVKPGDKCFFHAGGIDVRCDVHNAVAEQYGTDEHLRKAEAYIRRLVSLYLARLKQNEMEGVEFWSVAILPTAYSARLEETIRNHPVFPYVGTDDEIALYTMYMNAELCRQGDVFFYRFLDIYPRYADANDRLTWELGSNMHVADNTPILAEMLAVGLYTAEEASIKPDLTAITRMEK
jgi:hypothetical protein